MIVVPEAYTTHSEHSSRSAWFWKASASSASETLCNTFTPSKKNMSQTLRTDGHGRVLEPKIRQNRALEPGIISGCISGGL